MSLKRPEDGSDEEWLLHNTVHENLYHILNHFALGKTLNYRGSLRLEGGGGSLLIKKDILCRRLIYKESKSGISSKSTFSQVWLPADGT